MDLTNTARICPVGLYTPTLHICTPNSRTALRPGTASPTDTNEGSAMSFILAPLVKTVSSPPTGAHMVLSLPVSTTSYSRYVVSTVQTSINCANNGRALNDTGRSLFFIPFISITIFLSARSLFSYLSSSIPTFSSQLCSFCISQAIENHSTSSYISRVTGNHSSSTEF